jgi:hypothetical protein
VRGNRSTITLGTGPLAEDIDIAIRATRNFGPAAAPLIKSYRLQTILPLKVRANPAVPARLNPAAIVDFNASASIQLDNTQSSAGYRLFLHPLADSEFVYENDPQTPVLSVSVADQPDVRVRRPPQQKIWTAPPGYHPRGTARPGNGGGLEFDTGSLDEDTLIIVQAEKQHRTGGATVTSAVPLEQCLLLLARPNPAQPLRLRVPFEKTEATGSLRVFAGQPGVFYYFYREAEGTWQALDLPAYFHHWRTDESAGKGIGELRIEIDFVPVATQAPYTPLLDAGGLTAAATLRIEAIKARSGVAAASAVGITLPALSRIRRKAVAVTAGESTDIQILDSETGVYYQLLAGDTAVDAAQEGNGATLALPTGPIAQETLFTVRTRHRTAEGITLELEQPVSIGITSDATDDGE